MYAKNIRPSSKLENNKTKQSALKFDSQLYENNVTLLNHESFFQRKDPPQLHRFQFLEINSLMAQTIKKNLKKNL